MRRTALIAAVLGCICLAPLSPGAAEIGVAPQVAQSGSAIGSAVSDLPLAPQGPLSTANLATVARVETYLNRLDTVRSRFVQVASDGSYAEGELTVERPGMLRFEYDAPHPVLMIADGTFLLYYDKELDQSTFIPLGETPLWFLIGEDIRLSGKISVLNVIEDSATVSITLADRDIGDAGRVTLIFSDRPLQLHKWHITDAQGVTVQVALVDPAFGVEVDGDLFDYGDLGIYSKRDGGSQR